MPVHWQVRTSITRSLSLISQEGVDKSHPYVSVIGNIEIYRPPNKPRIVSIRVEHIHIAESSQMMDLHFLECMMQYTILEKNEYPVCSSPSDAQSSC